MDVKVGIAEAERLHLPERNPPPLDRVALLHGDPPISAEVHVIMRQGALRQVDNHGRSNRHTELGGVLLGQAYQSGGRTFIEVKAALPAHSDQNGPVHFTFTADAWARIHAERTELYPDLHIVGWFHTHPNLGVFYSADDEVVHSVAFAMPWHVGLVFDPVREEACFFGWEYDEALAQGRELSPIHGFFELTDEQPESVITWDNAHRPTLSAMRHAVFFADVRRTFGIDGPVSFRGGALSPTSLIISQQTLALSALVAAVVLFALLLTVWWMGGRANKLETAVLALAEERMAAQIEVGTADCPNPAVQIITPAAADSVEVGETVTIFGVANVAAASAYRIEVRPVDSQHWQLVDEVRWNRPLGELTTWQTAGLPPGSYVLRLAAVQRGSHIPLAGSSCQIDFGLLPAPAQLPTVQPTAEPLPNVAPSPPSG